MQNKKNRWVKPDYEEVKFKDITFTVSFTNVDTDSNGTKTFRHTHAH